MSRRSRKLTRWSATIALLTLVASCSSMNLPQVTSQPTGASSQNSSNNSAQKAALKSSKPPLPKSTHNIGEVVSVKDQNLNVQFTVNGIREHKGKRALKPNQGNQWILVDTTIANQGEKPKTISVVSFTLLDSKNNQYDVALLTGALEDVKSLTGQIAPGKRQRGEVGFEVPKGAKGLKLLFKPNVSDCSASDSKPKASKTPNCKQVLVKLN
jgi:Telomeric repeat-binding factor 2.